ncbi:MAG: hypothetical protein ACLS3C_11855 [Oscillospiraceae bacterium]
MEFLPNECKYLVQADGRFSGAFRMDHQNRSETDLVSFDPAALSMAEQTARQISRYWVNEIADGEIPNQNRLFGNVPSGRHPQLGSAQAVENAPGV